jgi:hypothetical protein
MAAVGIGAAALALLAGGAGFAAGQINSGDIQDNSVRSVDVKDGDLKTKDLNPSVLAKFVREGDVRQLTNAIVALNGQVEDLTTRVESLEDQEESGVNNNWVANTGSEIVDATTVALTGGNTSVEIENLNKVVQAGDVVSFDVDFGADAFCVAGAPRVFVEVQGTFYNSFDQATPCAGGSAPAADNATDGTITFEVPVNGRIGAAGVVFDNSNTGTVTISNLKVDGDALTFE